MQKFSFDFSVCYKKFKKGFKKRPLPQQKSCSKSLATSNIFRGKTRTDGTYCADGASYSLLLLHNSITR